MKETVHKSVLLEESIEGLNLKEGQKIVDCTLGGGGHTSAILEEIGETGKLLAIDADKDAIERYKVKYKGKISNVVLVNDNFVNLAKILKKNKFAPVDGILADFGFSSDQIEDANRGLSFMTEGPLDMRYDKKQTLTAEEIVNSWSREELTRIFKEYGEEWVAEKIAKQITEERKKKRITTTLELGHIVSTVKHRQGKIHPATQVFQALRIAVNSELKVIEDFLPQAVEALKPGGRLAVITFHSLEDRIVKWFFKKIDIKAHACRVKGSGEVKEKGSPDPLMHVQVRLINKKIIAPKWDEIKSNRRSRSAKLRVVERV